MDLSGAQKHVKLRQNVFFKSASPFPLKKIAPKLGGQKKSKLPI